MRWWSEPLLKYSTSTILLTSSSSQRRVQSKCMEGANCEHSTLFRLLHTTKKLWIGIICHTIQAVVAQRHTESGKAHLDRMPWLDTGKDEPAPCLKYCRRPSSLTGFVSWTYVYKCSVRTRREHTYICRITWTWSTCGEWWGRREKERWWYASQPTFRATIRAWSPRESSYQRASYIYV